MTPAEQSLGVDGDVDMEGDELARPHVDEYMLRFVHRALENVIFVPPVVRNKNGRRIDKNGRDRSRRAKRI